MELPSYLQHLRGLMGLLGWRVSDCLMTLPWLRPVTVGNLLRDVLDHGPAVDVGVGVEETLLDALLDDFPDGGLGQRPEVHLPCLLLCLLFPLNAHCLHFNLDEVVVGYLVDGVSHDGIDDSEVPYPQLVQLVALPVRRCLLS